MHNLLRRKPRKKQIMKNFQIIDIPLYLQKILYHIFQSDATTFSPAQPRYSTYPFCSSPAAARRPDKITRALSAHAPPSALSSLFLPYFYSLLRPFFSTIFSSQTLSNQYAAKRRSLPVARPLPLPAGLYSNTLSPPFALPQHPTRIMTTFTNQYAAKRRSLPVARPLPLPAGLYPLS